MGKRKVSILEPAATSIAEELKYRCVPYKKKYIVAYISQEKEIIVCEFVAAKLLG